MFCAKCGSPVADNMDFCTGCGARIHYQGTSQHFVDKRVHSGVATDRATDLATEVLTEGYNEFADTVVDPTPVLLPNTESLGRSASASKAVGFYGEGRRTVQPAPSLTSSSGSCRETEPLATFRLRDTQSLTQPLEACEARRMPFGMPFGKIAVLAGALVLVASLVISVVVSLVAQPESSLLAGHQGTSAAEVLPSGVFAQSEGGDFSVKSDDGQTDEGETSSVVPFAGSANVPSGTGSSKGLSDADAYKLLVSYYKQADDFDEDVSACAEEFNEGFSSGTLAVRSGKARKADEVRDNIAEAWDEVREIDMPFWSANYGAWEEICLLYEYLWHRVDVIDQAWQISLEYEEPEDIEEHIEEICEPLLDEQDASGQDEYYVKYKELYPTISLKRPY